MNFAEWAEPVLKSDVFVLNAFEIKDGIDPETAYKLGLAILTGSAIFVLLDPKRDKIPFSLDKVAISKYEYDGGNRESFNKAKSKLVSDIGKMSGCETEVLNDRVN